MPLIEKMNDENKSNSYVIIELKSVIPKSGELIFIIEEIEIIGEKENDPIITNIRFSTLVKSDSNSLAFPFRVN